MYSQLRQLRAQSVWDGSVRAADIYEGYGEHGRSNEGKVQDLTGLWSFVWHHNADDDYSEAIKVLQERGIFKVQ